MNKPNGQYVTPAQVPAFLQQLPLSKIPGVGKVTAKRLEEVGLITCADAAIRFGAALKRFGKFGRCCGSGAGHRSARNLVERLRTGGGGAHAGGRHSRLEDCETLIIDKLYPELEDAAAQGEAGSAHRPAGREAEFQGFSANHPSTAPVLNRQDLLEVAAGVARAARRARRAAGGLHVTPFDPAGAAAGAALG